MSIPTPRMSPLLEEDAPEEVREILRNWPYNLHRVLARNPATLNRWMPYAEHILRDNSLPEREREIAILRVAWNAQSAYEWGLHARLARSIGFSDEDLDQVARGGGNNAYWSARDAALMDGVDDIMREWAVGDAAWNALAEHYDDRQLIDYVFVVCQFILVAVTLRTLGVPLEPGIDPLPEITARQ